MSYSPRGRKRGAIASPAAVTAFVRQRWPSATIPECVELSASHALVRQSPVPKRALRPGKSVSGPTQFALIDTAAWFLAGFGALAESDGVGCMASQDQSQGGKSKASMEAGLAAVTQEVSELKFLRPARLRSGSETSTGGVGVPGVGAAVYCLCQLAPEEEDQDAIERKPHRFVVSWKAQIWPDEGWKRGEPPCTTARGKYSVPRVGVRVGQGASGSYRAKNGFLSSSSKSKL